MKKVKTVSTASFLFLGTASVTAYILRFLDISSIYTFIGVGVFFLILSGVLAAFAKKNIKFNIICCFISALSLGFLIRGWYIFREFDNPLWKMIFVTVLAVLYLWLFFGLAHIEFFNTHFKTYVILFVLLSAVIYTVTVFTTKTTTLSTFGFYMIIELAFIYAMCKNTENIKDLIRAITLSTFSVFIVALIIVLAVLLDADADFDLDFDIGADFIEGDGKKKKKNK